MSSIFRTLVALAALLSALLWLLPYFDSHWLSYDELSLLGESGLGATIKTSQLFFWATLIVWIALSIGLFFYIKVARLLFIVYTIFSAFMSLFYGIQVFTPIESFISYILTLIDGSIIAIMYLTSVSEKFNR